MTALLPHSARLCTGTPRSDKNRPVAVDLQEIPGGRKAFGRWTYFVIPLAPDDQRPIVPSDVEPSNLLIMRQIKRICQTKNTGQTDYSKPAGGAAGPDTFDWDAAKRRNDSVRLRPPLASLEQSNRVGAQSSGLACKTPSGAPALSIVIPSLACEPGVAKQCSNLRRSLAHASQGCYALPREF